MPGTIVTLVLYVIAVSLVVTNLYLCWRARERKAYAYSSVAFLNGLLQVLRREAASAQRQNDVEFSALMVRFEAAQVEAQTALDSGSYNAVNDIVDGVGREIAAFRLAQEQELISQKK